MTYFNLGLKLILDPLTLLFLFIIGFVSLPTAFYTIGYMKTDSFAKKISGWSLLIFFIISMVMVVITANALFFLIAWEVMSLISYFLVTFEYENDKSINAGIIYGIMTHIGTAFITAAILILYSYAGSFDFFSMKNAACTMPSDIRNVVFILFFIGFGTKAGVVPFHVWLPFAYNMSAGNVTGMMSGVMAKIAVYGMLRYIIFILGVTAPWWGAVVLFFACLSCLSGVIYTLMSNELKKILAYSSIENMGIILLGIGASMVFMTINLSSLSLLALTAGLFHMINHSAFKSLLFLSAGNVYKSSGVRDIEKLGGLIKSMPWTSSLFLAGALAIAGIPPLNGFISEWLTLQSLFIGALKASSLSVKLLLSGCAAVLALTGGLAAASFVKAFGITFLAKPRSYKAQEAKEVSASMKYSPVFLALAVFALAVFSPYFIELLSDTASFISGIEKGYTKFTLNNFQLMPQGIYEAMSPAAIIIVLAAVILAIAVLIKINYGKSKKTVNKTWGCGYYNLNSRTEYSATAFSKPFLITFSFFLRPYRKTELIKESHYHVQSMKYETSPTLVFTRYIYKFGLITIFRAAKRLRKLQTGSIHLYLVYIFITALVLIIFLNRF